MTEPLVIMLVNSIVLAVASCHPEIRRGWVNYFRAVHRVFLEMREFAVITPLRAITGRQRPNYRRIAALEREIGLSVSDLRAGQVGATLRSTR